MKLKRIKKMMSKIDSYEDLVGVRITGWVDLVDNESDVEVVAGVALDIYVDSDEMAYMMFNAMDLDNPLEIEFNE